MNNFIEWIFLIQFWIEYWIIFLLPSLIKIYRRSLLRHHLGHVWGMSRASSEGMSGEVEDIRSATCISDAVFFFNAIATVAKVSGIVTWLGWLGRGLASHVFPSDISDKNSLRVSCDVVKGRVLREWYENMSQIKLPSVVWNFFSSNIYEWTILPSQHQPCIIQWSFHVFGGRCRCNNLCEWHFLCNKMFS